MEPDPVPLMENPLPPPMTLGGRLLNVFVTPGEVFDLVKTGKPSTANWLAPILLACLTGIIYVLVAFSQPAVQQQMRDRQAQQFQKLVDTGKMTASQAEAAQEELERFLGPAFLKISGSAGAVLGSFGWLFFLALVIWLLGTKVFGGRFSFLQAVEVTGLSGMIGVLGGVIGTLLVIATGNLLITLGPALFIREFNPANKIHLLLAAANVMTLWYIGVLAVGLAKLSGVTLLKAAPWLFVPWLGIKLMIIYLGWGSSGM